MGKVDGHTTVNLRVYPAFDSKTNAKLSLVNSKHFLLSIQGSTETTRIRGQHPSTVLSSFTKGPGSFRCSLIWIFVCPDIPPRTITAHHITVFHLAPKPRGNWLQHQTTLLKIPQGNLGVGIPGTSDSLGTKRGCKDFE